MKNKKEIALGASSVCCASPSLSAIEGSFRNSTVQLWEIDVHLHKSAPWIPMQGHGSHSMTVCAPLGQGEGTFKYCRVWCTMT